MGLTRIPFYDGRRTIYELSRNDQKMREYHNIPLGVCWIGAGLGNRFDIMTGDGKNDGRQQIIEINRKSTKKRWVATDGGYRILCLFCKDYIGVAVEPFDGQKQLFILDYAGKLIRHIAI